MRDRVGIALRISSAALVIAGYMALASVQSYGAAMLLIPAILLPLSPLGTWLDERSFFYRVLSKAAVITYLCFIPLSVIALGLLDAVIAMVIFVQGYTLLHRREPRNYYHLFLMAFFLLLAACVQAPEPAIGLVMVLFLLSAIWAFLSVRLHAESRSGHVQTRVHLLPLKEGATAFVGDTANPFDLGLIISVSLVSLVAVFMTAAVFLLTPRVEAGFLGRSDSRVQRTGLSQTVDLRGGAYVQEDLTAVMRVTFPEEPEGRLEGAGPPYWRCTTLPRYYASQWTRKGLKQHLEPGISPLTARIPYRFGGAGAGRVARRSREGLQRVYQAIYMDRVPEQGMPCLDLVQELRVVGNPKNTGIAWDFGNDFTVMLTTKGPRRLSYEAWSEVRVPNPDALRRAGDNYQDIMPPRDYALLTYHGLSPETVALAERIIAGRDTVYDKAAAIEQWLGSDEFLYTLDLPALPPDSAIDAFLTQTKRGHCQLFSSAMALLLRSQGVPARVVSGYRGGEWSALDQSYTVRASMAHLWVEVLFEGYGWVRFDPSPRRSAGNAGILAGLANMISRQTLRAKMLWYQEVVRFDRQLQIQRFRDLSVGLVQWFSEETRRDRAVARRDSPRFFRRGLRIPLWTLMLTGGGIAAAWFFLGRRARERPQRWLRRATARPLTTDQARAARLYRRVCRKLRRYGIDCRGMTAEEVCVLAGGRDDIDGALVCRLVEVYNAARFGKRPLPRKRYATLRSQLRRLRSTGAP